MSEPQKLSEHYTEKNNLSVPARTSSLLTQKDVAPNNSDTLPTQKQSLTIAETKTAQLPSLIETERMTVYLEQGLTEHLKKFLQDNKITRDTLLESCYLLVLEDPELIARAIATAKERRSARIKSSNLRKAQTLYENNT